jgi:hypothetical protein
MMSPCRSVRPRLGPYVDGELRPADRLAVSNHVVACSSCADLLHELRMMGEALRDCAADGPMPRGLDGLAAGVVSRTRAEASQSWAASFRRGCEDWHWPLAGAGALCAAVFSVLAVAVICRLAPGAERPDSLAAMLNNLHAPAGELFMMATPVGRNQLPVLMKLDRGDQEAGDDMRPMALPASFSGPSGSELALALSEMVVRADGRAMDLRSMSAQDRQHTEAILRMQPLGVVPSAFFPGRRINVQALAFVVRTRVMGKAL